jgi:hypothetical protein
MFVRKYHQEKQSKRGCFGQTFDNVETLNNLVLMRRSLDAAGGSGQAKLL